MMLAKPLSFAAALACASAAIGQCSTLSFNGAFNGQKGTMFEVQNIATTPQTIGSFDQAFYNTGTADVEIYTLVGSCAGLEATPTAWTLLGSATGVAHIGGTAVPTPMTPIPIPINVAIPPGGIQSFYITATNATGSGVYYTTGASQYGVSYASNADLSLIGRTGMVYPFTNPFGLPTDGRLWNGVVNYCPSVGGTVLSTATPVGNGCVRRAASIVESSSAFDLSNTSLSFQFLGNGYLVIPGTAAIATQTSAPVTMGDDVVVNFPLGWTFVHPLGTTTSLSVSSNGFIHLGSNTANGCCAYNPALFYNGLSPCFAAKWRDLNPGAGGTVQFDTDATLGVAYITFTGVPDYGSTTNLNDFQYVLSANGNVELRFGTCAATAGATGYSPGQNNMTVANTDLSAITAVITDPTDNLPLALASQRPIANSTINLTTSNLTTGTLFGAILIGLFNPAIDLSAMGMPGCSQYSDGMASVLFLGTGTNSVVTPLSVPNLVGFHLAVQSAAFDPAAGLTALGAVTSNGLDLLVGDY